MCRRLAGSTTGVDIDIVSEKGGECFTNIRTDSAIERRGAIDRTEKDLSVFASVVQY
jgi:hypothetical protein